MQEITQENITFCDKYVNKLCKMIGKIADDDAYQAGRLGLCEASRKFDPKKSDSFTGYASWWIKKTLYRNRFGMNCTKKDAMTYGIDNPDLFCYLYTKDHEREVSDRDFIRKSIQHLTPCQKFVVQKMLSGMTCHEIAREYGKAPQNYHLLWKRAKRKIKKEMGGEYVGINK